MVGLEAILHQIESRYTKKKQPAFKAGDTVRVSLKVKEGNKERIQIFEGVVLGREKSGVRESFRVRRIASGVGVERVFPLHSPSIESIQVIRRGVVNRAKLFYLRDKSGKEGRITEDRVAAVKDAALRKEEERIRREEARKVADENRAKAAAEKKIKAEEEAVKKAADAAAKKEEEAAKAKEEAEAKAAEDAKAKEEAAAKASEETKAEAPAEEPKAEQAAEETK